MKAIGFTGMPGSGKSEAMAVARALGYPVIRMGDLVWDEVEARGLPRTSQHVGPTANDMREQHGPAIWAARTVERIRTHHDDAPVVMIDGIRSLAEVELFREQLGTEFRLVAIHTDQSARHQRMTARARDDDPTDDDAHAARDDREMGWGIARAIALADDVLVNDGTLDDFQKIVETFLKNF